MTFNYDGWEIKCGTQVYFPPFKPFIAIARKKIKSKIYMFNVEGNSLEEVIKLSKMKVNNYVED